MRAAAADGGTGAPGAAEIDQLRDEVAGLRRALESRPLIEQAKGVLMQRHGWTADHAFHHLVLLSQHLNIRLAEVAESLVTEAASPRGVEPTDEAWAYRLLDLLTHPAMTVRPVPSSAVVADFDVEYANPATIDVHGRTADQLVGRRLSKLYPSGPTGDIVAACLEAWHSTNGQVQTTAVSPVEGSPARPTRTMRLRAVPFLDRLLLTW